MLMPWLKPSYESFATALKEQRMPGSVVIAGLPGTGVSDLALACARLYLCKNAQDGHPCDDCKSCAAFDAGTHPDFTVALPSTAEECDDDLDLSRSPGFLSELNGRSTRQRRVLRIDTIRKLNTIVNESAGFSFRKCAIVHDAGSLGEGASNAILKTFEEPPSDSLIILCADTLDSLLPTILSRAFKIELSSIKDEEILEFLHAHGYEKERAAAAIVLSSNAPYLALSLLEQDADKIAANTAKALLAVLRGGGLGVFEQALFGIDSSLQVRILKMIIKEILMLKEGVALEKLPLIDAAGAGEFVKISHESLFRAMEVFPYLDAKLPLIPTRTPRALLRETVLRLTGAKPFGIVR